MKLNEQTAESVQITINNETIMKLMLVYFLFFFFNTIYFFKIFCVIK